MTVKLDPAERRDRIARKIAARWMNSAAHHLAVESVQLTPMESAELADILRKVIADALASAWHRVEQSQRERYARNMAVRQAADAGIGDLV